MLSDNLNNSGLGHECCFNFYFIALLLTSTGPRWASWNIGVFICIRCAGIHRNLGVHISRVKSVNLDQWTQEQIQVLTQPKSESTAPILHVKVVPDEFQSNWAQR